MKIAVVGTGYVGLVTGTCLSEIGNEITCIDIDEDKVKLMQAGTVPIYEPDLEGLFKRNIQKGRLSFTTNLASGIDGAQVIFLALPTPPGEDGSADLSYIMKASGDLARGLKNYAVIVDKSTVPVGTAEKVIAHIKKLTDKPFDVISNPEFLREGFAVQDFMNPDRIVIGTQSEKAKKIMRKLYEPFTKRGSPLLFMDGRSAEMTKYAANSFLATKISFMNEIANLAEKTGVDVDAVRLGIGADDRIGKRFLMSGIGYGGSCFPKDVLALQKTALDHEYNFRILEAVHEVNSTQKRRLANKVTQYYKGNIEDKTFALWGLAFKPDTDDIREAPSLEIIKLLTQSGARVKAYDPQAIANVRAYFSSQNVDVEFVNDPYIALRNSDALLIATEWDEFRTADLKKVHSMLKKPVVFDGRNLWNTAEMAKQGFYYESIGRKVVV